ncbi:hypothetical protein IQ235_12500 [Oscillatoriales cyanobacterium LEGE 11467]|uniref:Acyl carrier protein n=1 Tax=Zarconia navalis LEGE 11467 TaxID=1828826 RepID=A0A928VWU8_9CYAN|nr:hypothetical protein [Zarconia navalis]MBE9041601.1 hypothetical protein [Zarconia navalis LEGE 11467]
MFDRYNPIDENNYIEVLVLSRLAELDGDLLREIELDDRIIDIVDSADYAFAINLERDLGIKITNEDWFKMVTVRDAIELIKSRI